VVIPSSDIKKEMIPAVGMVTAVAETIYKAIKTENSGKEDDQSPPLHTCL